MFINEFFDQYSDDEKKAATAGAAVGSQFGKTFGKRALGALGGAGAALSGQEAIDRYRKGDKLGAAIAAAGGIGSLIPHPAIALGVPTAATAINLCRDDPETCKGFFTGKTDGPKLFEPREKITPAELAQQRLQQRVKKDKPGRGYFGGLKMPQQPPEEDEITDYPRSMEEDKTIIAKSTSKYDPSITSTKLVLYVNGKAVGEYESLFDARKDRDHLKKTFPQGKFLIKKVICRVGDEEIVENTANKLQASPELIGAIKDVESGNNPAAVSPKGAMGTMQVMPGTARDPGFGVQPAKNRTPQELERVGTDYFNAMLNKYGGDKRLALIAYNMGPGAADEWLAKGADPNRLPQETQGYVPKVLSRYGSGEELSAKPVPKPVQTPARPIQAPARPVQVSAQPVMPGPRTTTADYDWSFTPAKGKGKLNPQWTPPPGPKPAPQPKPDSLDPILRAKDRPESMDQLIKKLKVKHSSNADILDFVNRIANSQGNLDPKMWDYLNKLASDDTEISSRPIAENKYNLADELYNTLEITHGDLVHLYGHEVFGDAIEEVVIKHKDELAPDIKSLAKEVLMLLKSRHEEDDIKEEDDTPENDKSTVDKEHHNAVIQIQADLDKIKNTLDIKESKIYFNVLATPESELKTHFGLKKDKKGWYLKENANPSIKLDAMRAFTIL